MTEAPGVSVVIATRNRPELLRRAIGAIVQQRYAGEVEVLVVHDQCEPDQSLELAEPGRRVRVLRNTRTPGLAGGRNTGIAAASGPLIAFCDDDDEWLPGKLEAQVRALAAAPDASLVTTGIVVAFRGRLRERVVDSARLTFDELLRDRTTEAHPSTFLFPAGRLGLIDEQLPGSYAEDYDLLLRAARAGRVLAVPVPLVTVRWHAASYFADRWRTILAALEYLMAKYPEFERSPAGRSRIYGQMAFAHAALGERRAAARLAWRALRCNRRERRSYVAMVVASRLLSADRVLALAHLAGRGI